jgi:hypothetical protein
MTIRHSPLRTKTTAVFGAIGMYAARKPFSITDPVNQPTSAATLMRITMAPHACDTRKYLASSQTFIFT